jgi:hypothetical protein
MSTLIAMSKFFPLTETGINDAIKETKAGNYRFCNEEVKDGKNVYYARYVGRSDGDVKTEIKLQGLLYKTDSNELPLYSHFQYAYAKNADEAYTNECIDYHYYHNGLKNEIHPATPKGSNVKCPVDGCENSSKPKS